MTKKYPNKIGPNDNQEGNKARITAMTCAQIPTAKLIKLMKKDIEFPGTLTQDNVKEAKQVYGNYSAEFEELVEAYKPNGVNNETEEGKKIKAKESFDDLLSQMVFAFKSNDAGENATNFINVLKNNLGKLENVIANGGFKESDTDNSLTKHIKEKMLNVVTELGEMLDLKVSDDCSLKLERLANKIIKNKELTDDELKNIKVEFEKVGGNIVNKDDVNIDGFKNYVEDLRKCYNGKEDLTDNVKMFLRLPLLETTNIEVSDKIKEIVGGLQSTIDTAFVDNINEVLEKVSEQIQDPPLFSDVDQNNVQIPYEAPYNPLKDLETLKDMTTGTFMDAFSNFLRDNSNYDYAREGVNNYIENLKSDGNFKIFNPVDVLFKGLIEQDKITIENNTFKGNRDLQKMKMFLEPEYYKAELPDNASEVPLQKNMRGDEFDLLAATITSPNNLQDCFTDESKKPSVEGAFKVVHQLMKAVFDTRGQLLLDVGDENDVVDGGRTMLDNDNFIDYVAKFVCEEPSHLNVDKFKQCFLEEQLRDVAGNDGEPTTAFDSLLMQLPAATVSQVLKGLCRSLIAVQIYHGISRNGDYNDRENCGFSNGNTIGNGIIQPTFELIKEWREPIGDLSGIQVPNQGTSLAAVLTPPKYKIPNGVDFYTLDGQNMLRAASPELATEHRFAKLNPGRVDEMKKALEKTSGVVPKFVREILPRYLKKIVNDTNGNSQLRAKVMNAMVKSNFKWKTTDEKIWNCFGAIVEDLGPIMLKYLQGFELPDNAPNGLREVIGKLKSKMSDLPKEIVNAQLAHIKEMSGGRITDIRLNKSLGAATIGGTIDCEITTVYGGTEHCAIKMIRSDVISRMDEEKTMIDEIIREIENGNNNQGGNKGLAKLLRDASNERINKILEETNFKDEFDGVCQGDIYNGKSADVSSVGVLPFVMPDKNFLIMQFVEGKTIDGDVKDAFLSKKTLATHNRVLANRFKESNPPDRVVADPYENVTKDNSGDYSDFNPGIKDTEKNAASGWLKSMQDMLNTRNELLRKRKLLISSIEVWFKEAIKGSGFYHADYHGGNGIFGKKTVTFIDFGNYSKLEAHVQKGIAKMFSAIWSKNAHKNVNMFIAGLQEGFGQMNITDDIKKGLEDIFKKGKKTDDFFRRLQMGLEFLNNKGIATPTALANFLHAQELVINTLTSVNKALKTVDQSLVSSNMEGKWHVKKWPITNFSGIVDQLKKQAKYAVNVFKKASGNANLPDDLKNIQNKINSLNHKKDFQVANEISYANVIDGIIKDSSFAK